MSVAVWACICFGLCAVVMCALGSEAVRWDRRRPGAYARLPEQARRQFLRSILWPGLVGLTAAAASTRFAQQDAWGMAGALFAVQAAVLLVGAAWTIRVLKQLLE